MNIDTVFDPYEDLDSTIDLDDLPNKRSRIQTILRKIVQNQNKKPFQSIQAVAPQIETTRPGLTYIADSPGDPEYRTVWLDAKIVHNPVFRYAIFRHYEVWDRPRPRWSPWVEDATGWYDLYPGVRRLGSIGLFNENEQSHVNVHDSTLHLMQFADSESLNKFRLTTEYVPMHALVSQPAADTTEVFEDTDSAHWLGWCKTFQHTDFDQTEIRGIMNCYTNFDRMVTAFLGDIPALNRAYAAIGGTTYLKWVSHRLAKTYQNIW